jgi:hypothetical protein
MIQLFKHILKFGKQKLINLCKIKFSKNIFFLKYLYFSKAYYGLDENEREILKRERRRLQEQLRRVKRNEARYNQYEKQQMLLQIQQQNLALIQSIPSPSLSSPQKILKHSNSILSNLQLSLSEDDDNSSSSS